MSPAEELRYLILAIQREGNRLLADQLRPIGLTPAQGEVVRVLEEFGPLSLRGLGGLLVCETGSSPSRLVDRLVARGLVARRTSAEDARYVELRLTSEGRKAAQQVAAAEKVLHDRLTALIDEDAVDRTLDSLRTVAEAFPSGAALARRRARTGSALHP